MSQRLKRAASTLGAPLSAAVLSGRSLTVLCYHRVVDSVEPGLFSELNSATPKAFERQLDLIEEDHEFVGEDDIIGWIAGRGSLPNRPVLLTFDDGYRDNYDTVYPMLRDRGIPASYFLATGHIDTRDLLWWDRVSLLFARGARDEFDLPIVGQQRLSAEHSRSDLAAEWIEAAKLVPDEERRHGIRELPAALGVTEPTDMPDVSLTWAQIREMAGNGMSFGGHTRSHPILSRMSDREAEADLAAGLSRIRDELGTGVRSFAYPNGGPADFTQRDQRLLDELGISLAFSLSSGPALRTEITENPLAVRRIYVGSGDSLDNFRLKLQGFGRLRERLRG